MMRAMPPALAASRMVVGSPLSIDSTVGAGHLSPRDSSGAEAAAGSAVATFGCEKPFPEGEVTVLGRKIDILLLRHSLVDGASLHLGLGSSRFGTAVLLAAPDRSVVQRGLSMFLGETIMERMSGEQSASVIMKIVGGLVEMLSKQRLGSNDLEYQFTSKFRDNISVTTNIGDYTFMREMFGHISQAAAMLASTKPNVAASEAAGPTGAASAVRPATTLTCHKFQLEPAISVLGDFTPRVDTVLGWMGIEDHKNVIPRATHDYVTASMEQLIVVFRMISGSLDSVFA